MAKCFIYFEIIGGAIIDIQKNLLFSENTVSLLSKGEFMINKLYN